MWPKLKIEYSSTQNFQYTTYVLSYSPHNKYQRVQFLSCNNIGTGTFSISGHVISLANLNVRTVVFCTNPHVTNIILLLVVGKIVQNIIAYLLQSDLQKLLTRR